MKGKERPFSHRRTRSVATACQALEVDAVIDQLGLQEVVLVPHDASGPPAIDWALAHPERIAGLVLLNTYYQWTPSLRRPPAIALYSTPILKNLVRWMARRFERFDRSLYFWQVGRFISDPDVRDELVPRLYSQFRAARPAFWALNDDPLRTVTSRRRMIPRMRDFHRPIRIVFGLGDPWMNQGVARKFNELFPASELSLLPGVRHYVQVDEPEAVAHLILTEAERREKAMDWRPRRREGAAPSGPGGGGDREVGLVGRARRGSRAR